MYVQTKCRGDPNMTRTHILLDEEKVIKLNKKKITSLFFFFFFFFVPITLKIC